ncbi:P1 family peptidase [Candidatus Poriferisocius sp.]|uniref:P1 family peptidase n=1 Tax=Candidatus Poriferisocius sp. TaxID=3101276 RepID=UPI003B02191C
MVRVLWVGGAVPSLVMLGAGSGVMVGHWTDESARTGCTVVVLPEGTTASGEIRGGAPATRDFALLAPERTVKCVDAVVLSGGSAFGLAAVDGVMRWCEERGRGFETRGGRVPIVVGMSLYDLMEGDGSVRPGPDAGYAAAQAAHEGFPALGRVGAATGATMNKWQGMDHREPGGLGGARIQVGDVVVGALVAVNASGGINDGTVVDSLVQGTYVHRPTDPFADPSDSPGSGASINTTIGGNPSGSGASINTTIGAVITNARLDKLGCFRVARSGHGGMARALWPAHTDGDGDALVVGATGRVEADIALVRLMAAAAVEAAIRSVRNDGGHPHDYKGQGG